ncbi:minor head protein [Pseudoalteromonas phage vB_PspS-H40/1]|uniref:minor head protein n=1 Tax=Pseudoalteromonas phage vB_PspS-H40/1 TaxID=1856120 RepID=UPI0007DD0C7F|nr:minor head protein [Pseudoalteromonas phage vB_PspS-H40/1]ANI22078.1 hypothetical protein H401_61 [Pseudoalteromonas phage vB_PspS-H40/1]
MIEEFILWLQQLSQQDLQNRLVALSQSNITFIAYILTIRKSYLFGMAFLSCQAMAVTGFIPTSLAPPIYGLAFFCAILLAWSVISYSHITRTDNKNTLIACAIMILFLLTMVWDSFVNAYNQTLIHTHYENIIVFIHVCIIVSLYRTDDYVNRLVGKLSCLVNIIRSNVARAYFCYTVRKINQG